MIKDIQPEIDEMKTAANALQAGIGKVNQETQLTLNTNAEKGIKAYDEAVQTIKRSIATNKTKTSKSKKTGA